jgi:hypothetical protein
VEVGVAAVLKDALEARAGRDVGKLAKWGPFVVAPIGSVRGVRANKGISRCVRPRVKGAPAGVKWVWAVRVAAADP